MDDFYFYKHQIMLRYINKYIQKRLTSPPPQMIMCGKYSNCLKAGLINWLHHCLCISYDVNIASTYGYFPSRASYDFDYDRNAFDKCITKVSKLY
jgi:hypothetical protein